MQFEGFYRPSRHFYYFSSYSPLMSLVQIESEIGALERVIIHSPGSEIEAMRPHEAELDLYNDIIPLSAVQQEYSALSKFLHVVTTTYELVDLFAECLIDPSQREEFLLQYSNINPITIIHDELMALPAKKLATAILTGLIAPEESLAHHINPHSFIASPLLMPISCVIALR